MFETIPMAPCDECLDDPLARAQTPLGVAIYCGHHRTLAIHDDRFRTWIAYCPLDVEQAAETTAAAIADRALMDAEPANRHAV